MEALEKNENIANIKELREQIDFYDKQLLEALAKRMALIPQVAEYKKAKGFPRYQPQREAEVFESRREIAADLGINPDLAEKIMKLIIADAHRIEENIIGQ